MALSKLLIANRGEIAVRIARAAADLDLPTVAVHSRDDADSLHTRIADEVRALDGSGVAAYLDAEQLLRVAADTGCDAVHPGYGFLAENADFARRCECAGVRFVGPDVDTLERFGDKARARDLAERCEVPLLPGTAAGTSLDEALAFFDSLEEGASAMIKAVAGGGGRGMRPVYDRAELEAAYERCRSEARSAFGRDEVYVEQLIPHARHVEVQIVGDGDRVTDLGERECSLQRRRQKLVEIAPSPSLPDALRASLTAAAVRMAESVGYVSLGTFEFLVDPDHRPGDGGPGFYFMETNPRLQVEHTVTEEVTGVDLVAAQLQIAGGYSLAGVGLDPDAPPQPRGYAVQLRINAETMRADGAAYASGGVLSAFDLPSGPGVRVDTYGYVGYGLNPNFDSLLAKLVASVRSPRYRDAVTRAYRALTEFRIEGVTTNRSFLLNLLRRPEVERNEVYTRFVEEHIETLLSGHGDMHKARFVPATTDQAHGEGRPDTRDETPAGIIAVRSPMHGRVVAIDATEGDIVGSGQRLGVLEAMKMEHLVEAPSSGYVRRILIESGANVAADQMLALIEPADVEAGGADEQEEPDLDAVRDDLAEVLERHALGHDERRPRAVERRRRTGQRTVRENIDDLCDADSFIEYGALVIAAQRRRRELDDLIENTPADGMVTGIGTVNRELFDADAARCMVLAYDYTVLAGTQGAMNHKKKDRMLKLAEDYRLPTVVFAEGGGGRPGDTDIAAVAGLDVPTFHQFARLSGLVPLIGIVSGRCFAGNAALLGCCDVIIATHDANIGMGGPAMIEGGGLGSYRPEEVGPIDVQTRNGVVDVAVLDEAAAVAAARRYLSYFQGPVSDWHAEDARHLRRLIPENRLRVYDIRRVIDTLVDTDSLLELRRDFGVGMVTALVRIEGRPMGLIANNPKHLSGAIDADAADKAARFIQLCDAFGLPILSLCDTPGFMVGPEVEKTAQVRHVCRMFVAGANVSVPFFTVVLRKGYGLGAQAMTGGSFHAPFYIAAWPTGEFGGMGLEGAVRLGFRKELEAIDDPEERDAFYRRMVGKLYEQGKAINMASYFEIDAVIDPADTRRWIRRGLESLPRAERPAGKRSRFVDTW